LKHFASPDFWELFNRLPLDVQEPARSNYKILEGNHRHPSLHFKRVAKYWSVRVGLGYRALGKDVAGGILWGWIGSHDEYDKIV